ncbi:hypothetical protein DFS33DRAFT_1269299 [Desarmillaria ectypa]|nr:hypothetical protein DFS33DRAFT_1269299 [Desarmillaria ectypa]
MPPILRSLCAHSFAGDPETHDWRVCVGNCGEGNTGTDSEYIVALDSTTYGSGEYYNTYVSIRDINTGETQKGLVKDSCPSCDVDSIDMSTGLFTALHGSTDAGVFEISWEFVSDDSSS